MVRKEEWRKGWLPKIEQSHRWNGTEERWQTRREIKGSQPWNLHFCTSFTSTMQWMKKRVSRCSCCSQDFPSKKAFSQLSHSFPHRKAQLLLKIAALSQIQLNATTIVCRLFCHQSRKKKTEGSYHWILYSIRHWLGSSLRKMLYLPTTTCTFLHYFAVFFVLEIEMESSSVFSINLLAFLQWIGHSL